MTSKDLKFILLAELPNGNVHQVLIDRIELLTFIEQTQKNIKILETVEPITFDSLTKQEKTK